MARQFEYKIIGSGETKYRGKQTDVLTKLGLEGWELVGALHIAQGGGDLYFKREIESLLTHKQERPGYDISR
jgi:hypothetical protein